MGFPFFGKKSKKDSPPPVAYRNNRGLASTPSFESSSSSTDNRPRFTLDPKADDLLPQIGPVFDQRGGAPPRANGNGQVYGGGDGGLRRRESNGRARAQTMATTGGGSLLDDFMFDFERRIAEKPMVEDPEPVTPVSAGSVNGSNGTSKVFRLPGSNGVQSSRSTTADEEKINHRELTDALAIIRGMREEQKPRSSSMTPTTRAVDNRSHDRDANGYGADKYKNSSRYSYNESSNNTASINSNNSSTSNQPAAPVPRFNRKAKQQAQAGVTNEPAPPPPSSQPQPPSRNLSMRENGRGRRGGSSNSESDSDSGPLARYAQPGGQNLHQQPRSSRLGTAHGSMTDLNRHASMSDRESVNAIPPHMGSDRRSTRDSVRDSHLPSPPPSPALNEHFPNGHVSGYASDPNVSRIARSRTPVPRAPGSDYGGSRSGSPAPYIQNQNHHNTRSASPASNHYLRPDSRNSYSVPHPDQKRHSGRSHLSREPSPRPSHSIASTTDASDSDDEQSLAVIQNRHMQEQQRSRSRSRRPGRSGSVSSRGNSRARSSSRHPVDSASEYGGGGEDAPPPPMDHVLPSGPGSVNGGARVGMTPQQQQMAALAHQQMMAQMYYQQAAMQQRAILALQQQQQGGGVPNPPPPPAGMVPGPMTHYPAMPYPSPVPSPNGMPPMPYPSPVPSPNGMPPMPMPPIGGMPLPNGMPPMPAGVVMPMPNGMPPMPGMPGMMYPGGMVPPMGMEEGKPSRNLSRKKSAVSVGSRRSGWGGEE
ncbi:hypothetical protein HDV00_002186 [Rhizophlyctis rosea]|nr:hypothetical protein HDV00_002186 [Rhizophlyctis rosea]